MRRVRPSFAILALALAAVCPTVAAADPGAVAEPSFFTRAAQAPPEVVGVARDAIIRDEAMRRLQAELASAEVAAALDRPLVLRLTREERGQIDRPGGSERKYLVGVALPTRIAVDLSGGRSDLPLGATRRSDESLVWSALVRVPGATALRLHLAGLNLPAGAELYVYNHDGRAFGPYIGRGPLGTGVLYTHTVAGERLLLQLRVPSGAAKGPRFEIVGVGVMGSRFAAPRIGPEGIFAADGLTLELGDASNLCSGNADCVVNAACQSSPAVNVAKDAIASILFQSGRYYYICTGGLIADTDTNTVTPYFLTAHHCVSKGREASSVETYFDYETSCSNPDCTQPYNTTGETVGSTIRATGTGGDYSLLELSSAPETPDGVAAYLGWTTTAVANANGTHLFRISHPQGSPQAYSEHDVDASAPTCGSLPRGNFIYSRDLLGATEGGSSGSPVVNGSGQVVGQLYGACGTNLNDVCDAASNATVDGAFAAYFSAVEPFLDPGTGGGGCSPSGASCTSNDECCSGNCKGRPGNQTCK